MNQKPALYFIDFRAIISIPKMTSAAVKIGVSYVLGRCVPSVKKNAAKICVNQLVFDEKLNMVSFINKYNDYRL